MPDSGSPGPNENASIHGHGADTVASLHNEVSMMEQNAEDMLEQMRSLRAELDEERARVIATERSELDARRKLDATRELAGQLQRQLADHQRLSTSSSESIVEGG